MINQTELIQFLQTHYPSQGKKWCMSQTGASEGRIRGICERLKLRQDRTAQFFKDWQHRAAETKRKKTPILTCAECKIAFKVQRFFVQHGRKFCSIRCSSKRRWERLPHPRGFLGGKHTEATKEICARSMLGRKQSHATIMKIMKTRVARGIDAKYRPECTWKLGRANDLGNTYYRSAWERNYARYLNFLVEQKQIKSWEYEPKTFWFEKIKRGVVSYKPDFLVHNLNGTEEWHEVKGWMDARSKTKLKRMKKYYPDVKLHVIGSDEYKALKKMAKLISPFWE